MADSIHDHMTMLTTKGEHKNNREAIKIDYRNQLKVTEIRSSVKNSIVGHSTFWTVGMGALYVTMRHQWLILMLEACSGYIGKVAGERR